MHVPGPAERRDLALREAVRAGLLGAGNPAAGFLDIDALLAGVADLHAAFAGPAPVLHTFAVKAASLVPVLRVLAQAGMGCEVASPGELAQALAAGVEPQRIVLDSPAKTWEELEVALDAGVAVNADNLQEVERLAALLQRRGRRAAGVLGLRVNPQVGAGSIGAMSTASAHSKFGVPLRDPGARERVMAAFAAHPWLTRVHVHVGSQGCPLDLMAEGVEAAYRLAEDINRAAGRPQVTSIDIGGGLPVNFADDEVHPSFADYAGLLRTRVPGLFDGRYSLVTEFGRSVVAKHGFIAAVVEYTKESGGRRIAITHAGAHLATRTVFMPESWPLRVLARDAHGLPKPGPLMVQDVAGPCCFAGDLVAQARPLPELEAGDLVVLCDTGGYYVSTPWSYNSLLRPGIHGYTVGENGVRFATVRPPQSLAELLAESGASCADALLDLAAPAGCPVGAGGAPAG
ncbi:diaminopimelate decarboxylase [Peterkaempfera sp. SMS 1(5)a]